MAGFFLTLEGPDGAGKGTILNYIEDYFRQHSFDFISTKEPGSPESDVCKMLRNFVLNPNYNVHGDAEIFLYLADRCQHVNEVVKPALDAGKIVLCDRYIDSTYAYQGWGRRYGDPDQINRINLLNSMSTGDLVPDLTVVLLVDPEEGLRRIKGSVVRVKEFGEDFDRLEREKIEFHKRVYNGYLDLINRSSGNRNIVWFDTTNSSQEECWEEVKPKIQSELVKRGFFQ